ncbi:MAG: outer membrane protein assembly factor BamA [Candidatus Omnitrophica bacterium]|nr:outer membrane protein assembly factor BamA [Candidatus Omnitrophota bacterium]
MLRSILVKNYRLLILGAYLLAIGSLIPEALSQTAGDSSGGPVVREVIVSGQRATSSDTILARVKTRRGIPFSETVLNEDLKRIYAMGFFTDVSIDVKEETDGVYVTFLVVEKPVLKEVQFEGNRRIRSARLQKLMLSVAGEFLNLKQLKEDVAQIKQHYIEKGYADVSISYDYQVNAPTNEATVYVLVDEGVRLRVKAIEIAGNHTFPDKKILKIIKTRKAAWFRSGVLKQETLEEDLLRIEAFYRSEGFADAEAESVSEPDPTGKWIVTKINIIEGRRYQYGKLSITGNEVFPETELRETLAAKQGDYYSEDSLRVQVNRIKGFFFEKGYIAARVLPDTLLNEDTGQVDIVFQVMEGELSYVHKINIHGNTKTKDKVIRRELRVNPGERFDGKKLERSKQRLDNLGFFEEVRFDTTATDDPKYRDLEVEVRETKTGEVSFGAGFSSVDAFVGFAEIAQKNFDISNWGNFTGAGQDLRFRLELGSTRSDFEINFTEPWLMDRPLAAGFDLYNRTQLRSGTSGFAYDEERRGGDIRLSREIGEYLNASTLYRLEQIQISDIPAGASQDFKDEEGQNRVSAAEVGLTWDTRDSRFNPTDGLMLFGSAGLAGGPLGFDKDFTRYQATGMVYKTFFDLFTFQFRGRAGVTQAFSNTETVPIYERFFLGGANTVRGFQERDIGPRDVSGDVLGGESVVFGSIEMTFPLVENLKGAVFTDAGNVWQKADQIGSGGYQYSAGLGVRIKTPIGPVKLDYGYPLNPDDNQDDSGRFHFSMSRGFF